MDERCGRFDNAFSLTLTLSRWEREQPLDSSVKFTRLEQKAVL